MMQTPKSKFNHTDGGQKAALKSNSDSASSTPHQTTRTSKDRSPKITERRSPQGRANEQKRSTKLSDLEACNAHLQEELKKAKDQASSFEFQKRQAQQEVEEGKKQIAAIAAELEETKKQLIEISSSEDDRLQELCKISQERDKSWESELEAVRKQHSMDMGALTSAMYEIQKLKKQVGMVTELEAAQTKRAEFAEGEVQKLQFELGETLTLVERLKADMRQSRENEVHAQETASEAQRMLETVSLSANMVQSSAKEEVQTKRAEFSEGEVRRLQFELGETLMLVERLKADVRQSRENEVQAQETASEAQRMLETVCLSANAVQSAEGEVQTKRAEFAEGEVQRLQFELGETLILVERQKADVRQSRENEVHAQETASEAQRMLETVSLSANMIQSAAHDQVSVPFISLSSKSDQSEYCKAATQSSSELKDKEYINQLEHEISLFKSEISKMRAALDTAEVRYQDEYINSTLQIRSAYELVEVAKSESRIREAELEAEVKRLKSDIEEFQAKQKKDSEKPRLSDKENVWATELKKARASLADSKACLIEKEKQLEDIAEEKEKLNVVIQQFKTEKSKAIENAAEAEKVSESRVIYLTQEADRNSKKLEQVMELLDATQAANSELEAELRRITVQCDQWRKAAEAAAVMLTTGSDRYISRSESLDNTYHNTLGMHLSSAHSDEMDDDASKRKNGSMLQKMGVRWKKSNSNKQM